MTETTGASEEPGPTVREFTTAMINFDVVDRSGETIGRVRDVNLSRTCLVVETGRGRLFGRKQRHGVHIWAVRSIDSHTFKIWLAATKQDVAEAPEVHWLSEESEAALASYYRVRLVAPGDKVRTESE